MTVVIEELGGLQRRMQLTVPAEIVDQAYARRLSELGKTAKVPGFRPGKVPSHILEQRFKKEIKDEITRELAQSSFFEAVREHSLQVASQATFNLDLIEKGSPLVFTVQFEILPDVSLTDLNTLEVEQYELEVLDQDVDLTLNNLRRQQAQFQTVQREARLGDRVIIDFKGTIDGNPIPRGEAKDFQLDLGSKHMVEGFELGIVGMKAGEERIIKVVFPVEYHDNNLMGKETHFVINLHKIQEAILPALDDQFAQKIGASGLDQLRGKIKDRLNQELQGKLENRLKRNVFEKLFEKYPMQVPDSLIQKEADQLHQAAHTEHHHDAQNCSTDSYQEEARKRVAMGILLAALVKHFHLKVDPEKVGAKIEEIARNYPGSEMKVMTMYKQDQRLLDEVQAAVIEDMAVERLLPEISIVRKKITSSEMILGGQHTATEEIA